MGIFTFSIPVLTKCYSGDQIKNNEMGWACGAYEGKERVLQGFSVEK